MRRLLYRLANRAAASDLWRVGAIDAVNRRFARAGAGEIIVLPGGLKYLDALAVYKLASGS